MRKDDAQLFIMKARVLAGWIQQEDLDNMLADIAAKEVASQEELTEEERALMALGALGSAVTDEREEGGNDAAPEAE